MGLIRFCLNVRNKAKNSLKVGQPFFYFFSRKEIHRGTISLVKCSGSDSLMDRQLQTGEGGGERGGGGRKREGERGKEGKKGRVRGCKGNEFITISPRTHAGRAGFGAA